MNRQLHPQLTASGQSGPESVVEPKTTVTVRALVPGSATSRVAAAVAVAVAVAVPVAVAVAVAVPVPSTPPVERRTPEPAQASAPERGIWVQPSVLLPVPVRTALRPVPPGRGLWGRREEPGMESGIETVTEPEKGIPWCHETELGSEAPRYLALPQTTPPSMLLVGQTPPQAAQQGRETVLPAPLRGLASPEPRPAGSRWLAPRL